MKKLKTFVIFSFVGLFFFYMSCEKKDDLTQKDIVEQQQLIDLVIRIFDATSSTSEPVQGVVITTVNQGKTIVDSTNENGIVIFSGVQIAGNVPVIVSKANYTKISTTVSTNPGNYRQQQITQSIGIYPLSPDTSSGNFITVKGRLTIESDVTNREREAAPEGTEVKAYNTNISGGLGIAFIGATDSKGDYSIMVPVSDDGNDDIQLRYPDIVTDQTIALEVVTDSFAVVQRSTVFDLSTFPPTNNIPSIPSLFAIVDPTPSATIGAGFELKTRVVPSFLTSYSTYLLVYGGSGYHGGGDTSNVYIPLSPGVNGDTAEIRVDINNGSITNIDGFYNNGALYTSAPTLDLNVLGGTGAIIQIEFETSYRIYISNQGSGYISTYPRIAYEYEYWSGNQKLTMSSTWNISGITDIYDGKIYSTMNNGDTIATWTNRASDIDFYITDPIAERARININAGDINSDSILTDIDFFSTGNGYDPANPPTVRLYTLAGYGSGAMVKARISADGVFNNFTIVSQGKGYVDNVNDFRGNGTTFATKENPISNLGNLNNVKPGEVFIRDQHYGTGTPVEED